MWVRIIRNWKEPNILRQTPGGTGVWDGVKFILDEGGACDYAVILNYADRDIELECSPDNLWCISQEPPIESMKWHRKGYKYYNKVITSDITLSGEKYIFDSLGLPWHVGKNYDELISLSPPLGKNKDLSWITSNKSSFPGHVSRMSFLEGIKGKIKFDLFGKGINPIDDKWDGLFPYKYSLAVENYSGPYYWTEKISDCFLSWTMPIYYGCTNIAEYFPKESYISIDIKQPEVAIEIIQEAIANKCWEKNREALEYSRDLVLNKYNLFPYLVEKVKVSSYKNDIKLNKIRKIENTPIDRVKAVIAKKLKGIKKNR
jgi:hypothetical protein